MSAKYRLVTRSDFDGLVCAVLLKELNLINDISFVHPKDMQDGKVPISDTDITTNLPYVEGVYLAFDHHSSEMTRVDQNAHNNHIIDPNAPSAARVVYDYYGGKERFPTVSDEMMTAVDTADSAQYDLDQILNPDGWELLNFLMDARTGLGRFQDFRVSNYQLMMDLIDHCRHLSIQEILELPDVQERVQIYFMHENDAKEQIERCATVYANLVVLNLVDEESIWPTNRFTIYAMYPDTNISIHVLRGKQNQNRVFAIGKSIIDRSSETDVGELCLEYGGGGHRAAGTCQVEIDQAGDVLTELINQITADG